MFIVTLMCIIFIITTSFAEFYDAVDRLQKIMLFIKIICINIILVYVLSSVQQSIGKETTTFEITYNDSIPIDSIIVFKSK